MALKNTNIGNQKKENNNEQNTIATRTKLRELFEAIIQDMIGQKHKQFIQTKSRGFLAIECPDCHKTFGLPSEFVESIGESNYLYPYFCPFCGALYSLK